MRIVIKVGTSTLTHQNGHINLRRVEKLCRVISDLKNEGYEVILVSSGAIGMGVGKLSLNEKPTDIPTKQAAAAVGQCELMYIYDKQFAEYNHTNFRNTVSRLLEFGALPIINENDTVSTEEIVIGDNDTLGAVVATSISADLLVILSDIDGLYTTDPHTDPNAELISVVEEITPEIYALAKGRGTKLATGGMRTKLNAATIAAEEGISTIIANGSNPEILYDIAAGKAVGTIFKGKVKGE